MTIVTDYQEDLGHINVVPGTLTQAFINLIGNACDAMQTKQASLQADRTNYQPILTLTMRLVDEQVVIYIRDNGSGISPDIRSKILDPFFTTKSPDKGTGLGLSITYDIITQQHHGTLSFESQTGEFTEFKVTLPYQTESDSRQYLL